MLSYISTSIEVFRLPLNKIFEKITDKDLDRIGYLNILQNSNLFHAYDEFEDRFIFDKDHFDFCQKLGKLPMADTIKLCNLEIARLNKILENRKIDYEKRIRTFTNLKELPLNYSDYDFDALVFEDILSHQITLTNKDESHGVVFNFEDFPMLGIWTPNHIKSPFICLEPWIGCADAPQSNGDFKTKRDLINVEPNSSTTVKYSIKFF